MNKKIKKIIKRYFNFFSNQSILLEIKESINSLTQKSSYEYYSKDQIKKSYNHFKKYFSESIFETVYNTRDYAIKEAFSNHKNGYSYLEFGVLRGHSIRHFSSVLKDVPIYGFDSFEGLKEDWKGAHVSKWHSSWDFKKKPPEQISDNCKFVVGWIQDTLPTFIKENKDLKINFVHIDIDTYPTCKFILKNIKPFLINGAIILFDELYDFPGWDVGEYKALVEIFKEEEYKFLVFSTTGGKVVIKYNKIAN